jgi:cytochrome P450
VAVEYDPYADDAMRDPHPIYARLRAESPVHFLAKYDCWALARFEDVYAATLDAESFSAHGGTAPGQVLRREPAPHTFMTMDLPEHRVHRGLISARYGRGAVAKLEPRVRAIARELLAPHARGGELDAYAWANRAAIWLAAELLGLERDDAEQLRVWVDGFFRRGAGQAGPGPENFECAGRVSARLAEIVAARRRQPRGGEDHLCEWLAARIDGRALTDEEIVANLYSMLVVATETVPAAVANTLALLDANPAARARVLADRALIPAAWAEALRGDPRRRAARPYAPSRPGRAAALGVGHPRRGRVPRCLALRPRPLPDPVARLRPRHPQMPRGTPREPRRARADRGIARSYRRLSR